MYSIPIVNLASSVSLKSQTFSDFLLTLHLFLSLHSVFMLSHICTVAFRCLSFQCLAPTSRKRRNREEIVLAFESLEVTSVKGENLPIIQEGTATLDVLFLSAPRWSEQAAHRLLNVWRAEPFGFLCFLKAREGLHHAYLHSYLSEYWRAAVWVLLSCCVLHTGPQEHQRIVHPCPWRLPACEIVKWDGFHQGNCFVVEKSIFSVLHHLPSEFSSHLIVCVCMCERLFKQLICFGYSVCQLIFKNKREKMSWFS